MSLDEKVCVVTGSGGGIGRATAIEMARRGAKVVVSDVKDEGGRETAHTIEELGGEAIYVHCDLRHEDEVRGLMKASAEQFGGIDVLVNNAGVHTLDSIATIDELSLDAWNTHFEINLRGMWFATKYAAPFLRESTRGPNIVNAGSPSGLIAFPKGAAYGISKAGVLQLTRCSAVDLGPAIRVNCYLPGSTDTPMLQGYFEGTDAQPPEALVALQIQRRLADASELAKPICFLASDDASFLTGAMILVDGGAMAWRGTIETESSA